MVYHDWIHKNIKYKIIYHTSVLRLNDDRRVTSAQYNCRPGFFFYIP